MDSEKDEVFDRLTRLASNVLGAPIAAMTLLDATRQFIKSSVGVAESDRIAPVEHSFCQHAVRSREPLIIEDARVHPLVKSSPFVAGGFLSYAGVPITVDGGEALGAFCIADHKPRQWTDRELMILKDLSAAVESQIAAHTAALEAERRKALLETVVDTMGSGLVVFDADMQLQIMNNEAKKMLAESSFTGPLHERAAKLGLYRADGRSLFLPEELPITRAVRGERVENLDVMVRPPGQPNKHYCANITARPLAGGGAVMIFHDTTETKELERRARLNEALYHRLANNIPNALVYLVDRSWKVLLAEGMLFNRLTTTGADMQGKDIRELTLPHNKPQTEGALQAAFEGKSSTFSAKRDIVTFEAHCQPIYEGTEVVGAIAIYFDVTSRENEANELRTLSARLKLLLEAMSEGVLFEDANYHVQVVNQAALDMFNVQSPREVLGFDITEPRSVARPAARDSFAEPALASYDIDEKRRRGERVHGERINFGDGRIIERDFLPVIDQAGVHRGNLWMHRDVTERERTAARLNELSIRDELTGLFNRRGFIQRGQAILDAAESTGLAPFLFFVDLNGMKPINDQMGHHEGDRALVDTARLLEKAFGTRDLIARLGGDEFVVLVAEPEGKSPTTFERELKNTVSRFNDQCTRLYRVSVSVGYTEFDPEAPRTIEQLLNAADAQMYAAKRARQARGNVSLPPPQSTR